MHTPDCSYCGKRWSYGQTFKQVFKIKMICPHCGKENFYDASKKRRLAPFISNSHFFRAGNSIKTFFCRNYSGRLFINDSSCPVYPLSHKFTESR